MTTRFGCLNEPFLELDCEDATFYFVSSQIRSTYAPHPIECACDVAFVFRNSNRAVLGAVVQQWMLAFASRLTVDFQLGKRGSYLLTALLPLYIECK